MNRIASALRWMLAMALLAALSATRTVAAPAISNVSVTAVQEGGSVSGTERTWFIFRAHVVPTQGPPAQQLLVLPAHPGGPYKDPVGTTSNALAWPNQPYVLVQPFDAGHPANGAWEYCAMRPDYTTGAGYDYIAFIRGYEIANYDGSQPINLSTGVGAPRRNIQCFIAANETGTQPQVATAAAPSLNIYPSVYDTVAGDYAVQIVPIGPDGSDDRAPGPGQLGNGLRVYPNDSTSPNDGGGAHQFTWRVRVRTLSGLPPALWTLDWDPMVRPWENDGRIPRASQMSGVVLVLTGPGQAGAKRYLPMEIEPGQGLDATIYGDPHALDNNPPNRIMLPNYSATYKTGVNYRFSMLPTNYFHPDANPFVREVPTTFSGDLQDPTPLFTLPDGLTAQMVGGYTNQEPLIGRPWANVYAAFSQLDAGLYFGFYRQSPPPRMPFYTQAQGRVGDYRYYYAVSAGFRPNPLNPDYYPWLPQTNPPTLNFVITGWNPNDPTAGVTSYYDRPMTSNFIATTVLAQTDDYTKPLGFPGSTSWANQYKHPYVTPILTDGCWTDDLIENRRLQVSPAYTNEATPPYSAAGSVASNGRRSRVTTKTHVRFQCRVFHTLPGGTQTPITVRFFLGDSNDGTMQPHTMEVEPNQSKPLDYTQGVVYYFDWSFPPGQEGRKAYYFEADDGNHRAIWPRRPNVSMDPWGRYDDPQGATIPARSEQVPFGTNTVGKNYMAEPLVNHRPTLTNPAVSPTSGPEGQPYTYTVTYTDLDNDLPLDSWVILDNDPVNRRYRMARDAATAGNSPSQGIRYTLTLTQLPANLTQKHNYYFQFRDNWAPLAGDGTPIRREYGEWVTLPQGDDNGNPSGYIEGPIIVGNRLPSLSNPSVSSSDQANNTASLHDFFVTYIDPDNDGPSYVKVFVDLYETATNNRTSPVPDTGTNMVRVNATAPNYVVGEQYHLPSLVRLPAAPAGQEYRYRFETSDGKGPVNGVGPAVTEILVGDGSSSIILGTARTLTRVSDTPPTYMDPNGTRVWNTTPSSLYVWLGTGASATPAPVGSYSVDALQRSLVFVQAQDPGANTQVRISYRYQQTIGPVVGIDHAPALNPIPDGVGKPDVNYLTCQPLQGDPTTQFAFTIVYSDADNQAPATDDGTGNLVNAVRLVINGGGNHLLQMDPNDGKVLPIDYRKGIRYTGTVTLPVGKYTYHFEVSDGALQGRFPLPAPAPGPYELPGPSVEDLGSLLNPTIQPFPKGLSNQIYQFHVTYKNASGLPPSVPIELRIWDVTGLTVTKLAMNLITSPPDYRAGVVYQNAAILNGVQTATASQPLSWGAHRVNFGFQDRQASTTDQILTVNAPPVLSDPTPTAFVTPNPAPRSATVRFSVKYTDLNGDPPVDPTTKAARIKLFVADSTGTYVQVTGATLTPDPSTFPEFPAVTADAIKNGQVFTWSIPESGLPDSAVAGSRNIRFSATDDFGENAADLTVPNALTIAQAGLPYLQGPTIGQGANDGTLTPAIGTRATAYTYAVVYRNDLNVGPDTLTLSLYEGANLVKTLNLSDFTRTGTDFTAGVTYSYTTQAGLFNSGNHGYAFSATNGANTVGLPASGQFAGPYVNFPPMLQTLQVAVLSGGVLGPPSTADPTTGILAPTPTGSMLDQFVISVTYKDTDAAITPPSYVRIVSATNPDLDGTVLTPPAGPKDYTAGVVYTSGGLTLTPGAKQFHIQAADRSAVAPAGVDLDTVRFPASVEASNLTVSNLIQLSGPDQTDPVRQGTLSPIAGALSATYNYKVIYKHVAGTAPAAVNVIIWDPTGTVVVTTVPLSAIKPANPTPADYKSGVLFGAAVPGSQVTAGAHKYSFFASDGTATEQLPSGTGRFDGPTVNYPPTIDLPTVYVYDAATPGGPSTVSVWDPANGLVPPVVGSIQKQFVFRMSYSDQDHVGPTGAGYVRVVVNGQQNPIVMHVKTPPADYTGEVVYETLPVALTAGVKTFHFEISDGIDPVVGPDITGLTVRSTLLLSAPPTGTVAPASGPLSTDFTYQVMYQNADNTPPSSVTLVIDGDTANAKAMTKVGTSTDYVTGVVYSFTYRFPKTVTARNHTYRFTAVDTATTDFIGYYPGPTDGDTVAGPLINTATFTTTPNPLATGAVGNQYTVVGQLVTAPALAAGDNRAVRVQFVRPDGSGVNDNITVNADGTFTYTTAATLDQTGDWLVRFIWDGVSGKFDSITGEFPFKVKLTSIQISLPALTLNMISSPLIPANADPNSIYFPLDTDGNPIASGVTVLDMQAWSNGNYISYNRDPNFPLLTAGSGVWVRPTQSVVLSPQGKVWDKTQPYSISLPTGWSIIGPVSLTSLPWSGVTVRYQGVQMSPGDSRSPLRPYAWTYDQTATGTYKPYKLIQANDVLVPGQGYWVRALAPCEIVLPAASRAAAITRVADLRTTALQVAARTKTSIDTDNFVVLDTSTRSAMVAIEKPPYLGDYVSVQMLPANTIKSADIGRAASTADVVGFEVASNQKNTDVTVSFPNVAALGRRYSITAVDVAAGTRRSLSTAGTLTYNTGSNAAPRRFALIIGHATQNGRLVISAVRTAGRSSGSISMSYSLSSDATVQVDVLNSTGEAVRSLSQGRAASAGANTVLWDGRNGSGTSMPAGTYVLRLKATDAQGNTASYSHPVVLIR